jgi:hypothetical protein
VSLLDQLIETFDAVAVTTDGIEVRICCPGCRSECCRWRGSWFGGQNRLLACTDCGQIFPLRRHSRSPVPPSPRLLPHPGKAVRLVEAEDGQHRVWRFTYPDGEPVGSGLFPSREMAVDYAMERGWDLLPDAEEAPMG